MNILYCGDSNIEKGLILSVLSLVKNVNEPLQIYVLTMSLQTEEKMFMPDQSALNKLAVAKKIMPRRFNEQRRLHHDTILQHFTTSFRFFPYIRTVTVKPWMFKEVHSVLKLHEYDELFEEYQALMSEKD